MITKEYCLEKYRELKQAKPGGKIMRNEYLSFANVDSRKLGNLFGDNPFSKLQEACGDRPNKLDLEGIPLDQIMKQYGELAKEILNAQGRLPVTPHWDSRGLRPTTGGIRVEHEINWSNMPEAFLRWVEENKIIGYELVTNHIKNTLPRKQRGIDGGPDKTAFTELIGHIQAWSPARRRNSEGEYKIELRKHLEERYTLNEEYGQSNFDLLVNAKFAIETKKCPNLAEYDRLFGQTARHLQHQLYVVVIIFDVATEDHYENFLSLIDQYLNKGTNVVEVVKK